jgi:hypothetical protein
MFYGDPSGVYGALRRDATELLQFVRALEHQVGPGACAQARPDYDDWLGELEASFAMQCEQCGAMLLCDMLGVEAYFVATCRRACPRCYDRLQERARSLGRRWARLIVHATDHPELLAGPLVRWSVNYGIELDLDRLYANDKNESAHWPARWG